MLTVTTWNVNSLRARLPHLAQWFEQEQPDILALQETKVDDPQFPAAELHAMGYQVVFIGQKSYNGVALLSRLPLEEVSLGMPGVTDEQKRIIGATLGGVRFWNFYVPNGSSVGSEKYEYKLNWLSQVSAFLKEELTRYPQMVLMGDFNIAPADEDVYDPAAWAGQVLVSDAEREALSTLLALGFVDCFRLFPQAIGAYSWWDYRQLAFRLNRGLRIDHVFATKALATHCKACWVDKTPRKWERPSDHAPVLAQFELAF